MAPAGAANFLRPGANMLALPPLAAAAGGAGTQASAGAGSVSGPDAAPASGTLTAADAVLAALHSRRGSGGAAPGPSPQGRAARRNVLAHFSEATVMPRHLAEVMQAWTAWRQERDRKPGK